MFCCVLLCFFEVFPDGGPDPRPVDSHLKIPDYSYGLILFRYVFSNVLEVFGNFQMGGSTGRGSVFVFLCVFVVVVFVFIFN